MSDNQQKSIVLQELEVLENFLRESREEEIIDAANYIFERVKLNIDRIKRTDIEKDIALRFGAVLEKVNGYLQAPFLPSLAHTRIPLSNNMFIEQAQLSEKKRTNYIEIDFTDIEFYEADILADIEKHLFGNIEGTDYNKSEMSYKDRAFLNGIIRKTKPETIVEIGVAAGASACIVLNAIGDTDNTKLYSFDYNSIWYRDGSRDNGRKTGFLVNQIIPELMSRWELYTGGVPCKFFDNLPEEGIDICFIDTAHFNPGEHLNILEILPFMKKNGIVIYHDTAYHLIKEAGTTNCVSINSLNGKRIYLKSERTMGLPNIGAIILDDNIGNMLFALFSNLSLPWNYKITNDDFFEIFKHFSKYYPRDLVQIYVYYCYYYMNGGHKNKEYATQIAEKETMDLMGGDRCQSTPRNMNKKPIVAMVNCDAGDNPSETFVRLQREKIKASVNYYNNGSPPFCMNGAALATPYNIARLETFRQSNMLHGLNDHEILIAMSFIDENTDVVFAQFGTVATAIMNVCKQVNLPLIVHFHGFDISVKTVIENHIEKYKEMFEYATYIIAVSQYMKQKLISLGCPQRKIIYNPCAANDEYYNIQPTFSKKLFIGGGRFVHKKAPQNTIRAFQKVLQKHQDSKLILAGDGELFEYCENLVKRNNLEDSVFLPKVFNSEQLKQWLSEAAAFVQHSITAQNGDMEGTPVIVCEASLAGLPVISTFHAGIPDVVIAGKTGLLVKEGDIDGMAQNMIWVLDNPEKAKEMGLAGKEHIWKNFNMKKHIGILDEIVYKAMKENRLRVTKKRK